MLYYATIYSPYTVLSCQFEMTRTYELFESLSPEDQRAYNCDVSRISWPEYIQVIHIPGLKRHVLKMEPQGRETTVEEEVAERSGFEQQQEEPLSSIDTLTDTPDTDANRSQPDVRTS